MTFEDEVRRAQALERETERLIDKADVALAHAVLAARRAAFAIRERDPVRAERAVADAERAITEAKALMRWAGIEV